MSSTSSIPYILAHRILPDELTQHPELAIAEWQKDHDGYLHTLWTRAALAAGRAAESVDRVPADGSNYDWPDGMRALVVTMPPPYAVGDIVYCGAFWKSGQLKGIKYVTMAQEKSQMKLTIWKNGKPGDSGAAGANSAATFANLSKMMLSAA